MKKQYQIGQFSRITRITVKALRHYQEQGVLNPTYVDEKTGYRYYGEALLEKAQAIQALKELGFSLEEIANILKNYQEDEDMAEFLKSKADEIQEKLTHYKDIRNNLNFVLLNVESTGMKIQNNIVEMKEIPDQLIASVRYQGRYEQIGEAFKKIYKAAGFHVAGKPGALYYDDEFKEEGADIEGFVPIKKSMKKGDVTVKNLLGGKAYCITHVGPYERISQAYKKIMDHLVDKDIKYQTPIREIYKKGPGMIFKGNPEKYVTEIQFLEV